jgi:hypothetical protein
MPEWLKLGVLEGIPWQAPHAACVTPPVQFGIFTSPGAVSSLKPLPPPWQYVWLQVAFAAL